MKFPFVIAHAIVHAIPWITMIIVTGSVAEINLSVNAADPCRSPDGLRTPGSYFFAFFFFTAGFLIWRLYRRAAIRIRHQHQEDHSPVRLSPPGAAPHTRAPYHFCRESHGSRTQRATTLLSGYLYRVNQQLSLPGRRIAQVDVSVRGCQVAHP